MLNHLSWYYTSAAAAPERAAAASAAVSAAAICTIPGRADARWMTDVRCTAPPSAIMRQVEVGWWLLIIHD
ncbi:hypothetical protein CGLO_09138 [Colletotrichum gloeosporioides Cg-14]|uniref:Uncharacterized protein n=1 Tax=Colletotrichum gloeosporioides (strain Cg-14) TaxID=1237896 RepID=T0KGT1_COLGC|nr:hypothetical protein CGLO_09138 [Colletotrichum gloeosporioides Cg-14]